MQAPAQEVSEALEAAVIKQFSYPRVQGKSVELRTDNGSQFGAWSFVGEAKRLGLVPTKTYYQNPEGNGVVERFFRTLKEECVWQYHFRPFAEAEKTITAWIAFYNTQRMHSQLGYLSPHKWRVKQGYESSPVTTQTVA